MYCMIAYLDWIPKVLLSNQQGNAGSGGAWAQLRSSSAILESTKPLVASLTFQPGVICKMFTAAYRVLPSITHLLSTRACK
jgi:hypothetical protein